MIIWNLINIKKTLTSCRFPATSPSKLSQVFSQISTTRIVRWPFCPFPHCWSLPSNHVLSCSIKDVDVEAVFLHPDEPALEFEGFLKKQYPRVRYFQVIEELYFHLASECGLSLIETLQNDDKISHTGISYGGRRSRPSPSRQRRCCPYTHQQILPGDFYPSRLPPLFIDWPLKVLLFKGPWRWGCF